MRAVTLVLLLLSALILPNGLGASIYFEYGGNSVLVEVGDNDELLCIHPDGYGLQVELFL